MLTNAQFLILAGFACLKEARQRANQRVVVAGEKQREGVAFLRHLAYAVCGCNKCASAQDFQHVADINHESLFSGRVLQRRGVDPVAIFIQHFKTRLVGEQQGEAFIVGVCTNTGNIFGAGVKGVVDQPQL